MKKKIILVIIIFSICTIGVVIFLLNGNDKKKQNIGNNQTPNNIVNNDNEKNTNITNTESENKVISNINVIIDGKIYDAILEENSTAQMFANMLPQEYNMNELNGNEKYIYLESTLPTNSYNPKHIESGDIMLYDNNCLVVFYKSFSTSYSYTKIGHIENMEDLGNENVTIKFEK